MSLLRDYQKRIACAWHVLRGRPLMYRMRFVGPITLNSMKQRPRISTCDFQMVSADDFRMIGSGLTPDPAFPMMRVGYFG